MNGTFSLDIDPPARGSTVTVSATGGSQGAVTVTLTDETGRFYTIDITVDASGNGSASTTIPGDWGGALTISATGYNDFNTAVS